MIRNPFDHCEVIPLCKNSDLMVYHPKIEFFYDRIRSSNYFSFPRQQHAIWDFILAATKINDVCPKNFKLISETITNKNRCGWSLNQQLVEDLLNFIHSKKSPNLLYAVSDVCFYLEDSPSHEIDGVYRGKTGPLFGPRSGFRKRQAVIKKMLPPGEIPFNAVVWRTWAYRGQLEKFISDHRDRKIVVVGPPYFKDFGERANLKDYEFVEISYRRASDRYQETYANILQKKYDDALYLLVGGFVANWLAFKLHSEFTKSFIIDIGRALDIYYRDIAKQMNWGWLLT